MSTVVCPQCHATTPPGNHCSHCGGRLTGGTTVVMQQQQNQTGADGMCLAAMIVGIASLFIAPGIGSIVAIVLAVVALNQNPTGTDRTYALVGLWTGIAGLVLMVLIMIWFMVVISSAPFFPHGP